MRAVEQIIRYLHEHGSLSRDQLAHLERLGLWHRSAEEVAAAAAATAGSWSSSFLVRSRAHGAAKGPRLSRALTASSRSVTP